MFIRWSLPNGTKIWHRADHIRSVEKHPENKVQTIVSISVNMNYPAEESQSDIVNAICEAMKTGLPQIVKESAPESPPRRLIS